MNRSPTVLVSRHNPRVRQLHDALTGRLRPELVGIEGANLVREAIQAHGDGRLRLEAVFLREDRLLFGTDAPSGVEIVVLAVDAFDHAAATEQPQGVAAIFKPPQYRYRPVQGDLLLVATGIQDPGNLGTLIRSAEAFGAAAVALATGTVNPWNEKCVRASAGSVIRMPLPKWQPSLRSAVREASIPIYAAVPPCKDAVEASETDLRSSGCALVIGNEANGIPQELLNQADGLITLRTRGLTESLNAAVAGSILLYEAHRQSALPASS